MALEIYSWDERTELGRHRTLSRLNLDRGPEAVEVKPRQGNLDRDLDRENFDRVKFQEDKLSTNIIFKWENIYRNGL